jgi:hypothetical protein
MSCPPADAGRAGVHVLDARRGGRIGVVGRPAVREERGVPHGHRRGLVREGHRVLGGPHRAQPVLGVGHPGLGGVEGQPRAVLEAGHLLVAGHRVERRQADDAEQHQQQDGHDQGAAALASVGSLAHVAVPR